MITEQEYWMGRDVKYADLFTDEIKVNGLETVVRVNSLLLLADDDCVPYGAVASGWRPQPLNDGTTNAAIYSKHITARACDIRDGPNREFARWCLRHLDYLRDAEVWMEDPRWTPTWVHLQTVPPGSGKRVFIPSSSPPSAAPLPGQT